MTQDDATSTPRTETTASLVVLNSSVTSEDIVKCIGQAPSAMWEKGDRVQRSVITRKSDGWKIDSTLPRDRPLSEHANEILNCVYPNLCFLKQDGVGRILLSAAIYIYSFDRPPLAVDAEAIRKLAELGASLDIDLYSFP
jgi:hypothetical protein